MKVAIWVSHVGKTMNHKLSPTHHHKYITGMFIILGFGWFVMSALPPLVSLARAMTRNILQVRQP